MTPSENWGRKGKFQKKGVENKIINKDSLKSKLDNMSMKNIRLYVKQHGLNARDNDKEELIQEILKEVQ